jgi:hypothetical protein
MDEEDDDMKAARGVFGAVLFFLILWGFVIAMLVM